MVLAPFPGWIIIAIILCVVGFFVLKFIIYAIYFVVAMIMVFFGGDKKK